MLNIIIALLLHAHKSGALLRARSNIVPLKLDKYRSNLTDTPSTTGRVLLLPHSITIHTASDTHLNSTIVCASVRAVLFALNILFFFNTGVGMCVLCVCACEWCVRVRQLGGAGPPAATDTHRIVGHRRAPFPRSRAFSQ